MMLFFPYRNPAEITPERIDWRKYLRIVFSGIGIGILLVVIVELLIGQLLDVDLTHKVRIREAISLSFFIKACILAPVLEEVMFRLPLVITRRNLAIGLGLVTYFYFSRIFLDASMAYEAANVNALAMSMLLFAVLFLIKPIGDAIANWLQSHYLLLYFSLLIAFGFTHITNMKELSWSTILLTPFITLPYLWFGYVAGYLRLKYGLIYSMLFHFVNNVIPVSIVWIYMEFFSR